MKQIIQSVLFDKRKNTIDKAIQWLDEHGLKYYKIDTTHQYHRFRQIDPTYSPDIFYRTITVNPKKNIKIIVEYQP
jgi:hypothetical protein